jgi:hypothetical protein
MDDTEPTVVMFRKWRNADDLIGDGVIALFPYELGTNDPRTCECYEHVGQHGDANLAYVISATRPATPEEYGPLKRELESAPFHYRLTLRMRTPNDARGKRRAALRGDRPSWAPHVRTDGHG